MTSGKKELAPKSCAMGINEIKEVLPHRYPFLLVDRIIEIGERTIVGIKNVTVTEPFFQGHFPDRPIMPGVLIVEALAQVAGIFALRQIQYRGKFAYFVSITNARFRKLVIPGDQLRLEVEALKLKAKIAVAKGVAKVDGEEVCDCEFMFSFVE